MANKAFIFDLDGVLIDNETLWEEWKERNYPRIYGTKVAQKLGPTVGKSIDDVYEMAIKLGSTADKSSAMAEFTKQASYIYGSAPITSGLESLGNVLVELGYAIGIVSASPLDWVKLVVERLPFQKNISVIISLQERSDLAHKPAPDGYNEAILALGSTPNSTIILEDANPGIASAKASGALVIGIKQNLLPGYKQQGADIYIETASDVIPIVQKFNLS